MNFALFLEKIIHRKQKKLFGSHLIFDRFVKFQPSELYHLYGMLHFYWDKHKLLFI